MTIDPEVKREIEELKKRVSGLERQLARADIKSIIARTTVNKKNIEKNWKYAREIREILFYKIKEHRKMIHLAGDEIKSLDETTSDLEKYIFDNMKRIEKLERFKSDVQRGLLPRLPFL